MLLHLYSTVVVVSGFPRDSNQITYGSVSLQCSRTVSAISFPVSEVPFVFPEDVLLHAAQCQVVLIVGRHTYAYSLHAKSILGFTSVILQICSTWLIITLGYSRSHSTCACLPVGEG